MTVKGFKKCCLSNAVDETDDDMLWNSSEEVGDVSRNMETVTLIGTGRWNLTCFLYYVYRVFEVNNKIFFLSSHDFFGRSS